MFSPPKITVKREHFESLAITRASLLLLALWRQITGPMSLLQSMCPQSSSISRMVMGKNIEGTGCLQITFHSGGILAISLQKSKFSFKPARGPNWVLISIGFPNFIILKLSINFTLKVSQSQSTTIYCFAEQQSWPEKDRILVHAALTASVIFASAKTTKLPFPSTVMEVFISLCPAFEAICAALSLSPWKLTPVIPLSSRRYSVSLLSVMMVWNSPALKPESTSIFSSLLKVEGNRG